MVTISSALAEGTEFLKTNIIDTPRLDCEVLLSHILNCPRLKLLTERNSLLNQEQYERFKNLLNLRAEGQPAAYLTGKKEFMGIEFVVTPGVLIPRGDTEIAAEKVIEECRKKEGTVSIVDIGCGSGAIGISTAKYVKDAFVTLIDISREALETASENARLQDVEDRVRVLEGDLLDPVAHEKFDIIVSNPPYIETGIIPGLQREVRDFEPLLALDGGVDGLDFYKAITSQASKSLKPGGVLIYEIGYNQAQPVSDILEKEGFKSIEVFRDLAGHDRCVMARM